MKEIGLYVHIPFCKQKCYYCDFLSYAGKEKFIEKYITSLEKEIEIVARNYLDVRLNTIYIGGGTPSYIDSDYIKRIMKSIKENFIVEKTAEITIEVNPGTASKEKIKAYIESGINRMSIRTSNNK